MIDRELWGPLADRYGNVRSRKMLALDGGGIRGVLTLAILAAIEKQLGQRLGDYFDYIAGTSTGAIIAAGLAKGMSVDELVSFYRENGPGMFQRTRFLARLNSLYGNGALEQQLKVVFGADTDLKPGGLKSLLLVVTRPRLEDVRHLKSVQTLWLVLCGTHPVRRRYSCARTRLP